MIGPAGFESFVAERDVFGVCCENIESEAAKDSEIGGGVVFAISSGVFGEQEVELPMELIFDGPMVPHGGEKLFG